MNRTILTGLVLLVVMPSMAADVIEPTPADSSRVVDLDEVIVVAQPKEHVLLRQQPLSSNAFGEEAMQRLNVHDLSQLSEHVPSFVMPAYGSRLTSSMYVRGIGSRINNPAVGIYSDNIPLMSKSAFNNHFYMLDRVDVLRGPQGTLYGQNTEGGLVRIYSKNPMSYQGTNLNLSLGTGFYRNVELAHYHRPSDKLAFSVAGFYSGLDGFFDNANLGEKNDRGNEAGAKVHLIYEPTQKLKIDWTADYQYTNQNGFGYGEYHPIEIEKMQIAPDGLATPVKVPADTHVADPSTTTMNFYKRNMLNTGLTLSYAMPSMLLSSITSYQYLRDQMEMDQDYLPEDFMHLSQRQKQNAVTEEIVLRSNNTSRWQHTSGLFGAYQWLRTDAPVNFGEAITGPISRGVTNAMRQAMQKSMYPRILQQMLEQGLPQAAAEGAANQALAKVLEGVSMTAEMAVPEFFHTPQATVAAFHESNIYLSDQLKLTLGLRFNVDKVKIDYDVLGYMNMTGGTAERQATYHLTSHLVDNLSKTYCQLLPKVGLTYSLSNNRGNVYALVSKGYRTGGYNIQMFNDILRNQLYGNQQQAMQGDYDVPHTSENYESIEQAIGYKPEESWNYEAGTHLNLFDGRLHADVSLFYMKIRNQQLSIMSSRSSFGRTMVNAGKSHSCGIEATLRGQLIDGKLEWSAAYSFTNAKFDEYDNYYQKSQGDYVGDHYVITYKDNYVPFVPQHTFAATADYHLGKLTLGANLAGQGKTWWDEANTFSEKAYATLGAHADYDFGALVVSLWGRNLTDTKYNTFAVSSSAASSESGSSQYFAQRATPLQVGIDARIHF